MDRCSDAPLVVISILAVILVLGGSFIRHRHLRKTQKGIWETCQRYRETIKGASIRHQKRKRK